MPDTARNALPLLAIVLAVVIGAVLLIALDHQVPDQLWGLAVFALGGGAGVTHPHRLTTQRKDTP